jgi:hypothetical protein
MASGSPRFSSSRAAARDGESCEARMNADDGVNAAGGEEYGRQEDDSCRGRYG